MKFKFTSMFFFCLTLAVIVNGQTANNPNLVNELLGLPAPPAVIPAKKIVVKERPVEFFSDKNVPPDDAPIEDLLDYWKEKSSKFDEFRYNLKPSKETLNRIIDSLKDNPDEIQNYLRILPPEPEIVSFVKNYYENQLKEISDSADSRITIDGYSSYGRTTSLTGWLRANSDIFVNDLIQSAESVRMEGEYMRNQEDFEALARVAWDRAKPFIDRFESNRSEIEKYTLAKFVQYHHALKEGNTSDVESFREELKEIVEDKSLSHKARDLAMDALVLGGDFEGRTEWYMSLLKDETLLELQDNNFTGLTTLPRHLPTSREDWMPSMINLIEKGTPAERTAAIRNLMKIRGEKDTEVLKLLLPWLSDKNWAKESDDDEREELVTALGDAEIPEAIPGLINVIINEKGKIRSKAALAVSLYDAPQAIPALRAALRDEESVSERDSYIAALMNLKGFSIEEQLTALETYAAFAVRERVKEESDEEDYDDDDKPIPIEVSVGGFISRDEEPDDMLILRAIERIKVLRRTNPPVADELTGIMRKWKNRLVDLEMLDWMKTGKADIPTILKLLANRKDLQKRIPSELSAMRTIDGLPRGLSAILAEDQSEVYNILKNADPATQIAVLAGARLIRLPISVSEVAPFLSSPNKTLALAAERYLEAEDSPQARSLILAKYPEETRILGAKRMFLTNEEKDFAIYSEFLTDLFQSVNDTGFDTYDNSEFSKTEKNLRDEIKQNPDLQAVFALIENKADGQMIVRLFKDKIVFTLYEDEARYLERPLSPKEYESFYRFLIDSQIDTFKPSSDDCFNCGAKEFLMFGRGGGRRVFFLISYAEKNPMLDKLSEFFQDFTKGDLKLHYKLSDKLKGLEIILADKNFTARSVWKNGNDLRVLVEDNEKKSAVEGEIMALERTENAVVNVDREQLSAMQTLRRRESFYKHFAWRKIEENKLSNIETAQPEGILYLDNKTFQNRLYRLPVDPAPINWRNIVNGFEFQAENEYMGNIVKLSRDGVQTTIKEGSYRSSLVSSDGRWIVAKQITDGEEKIVVINLQTGKESIVNGIPPADFVEPQIFVSSQNKFLILRSIAPYARYKNNPSPKTPEYYLLDPNTGAVQLSKGNFIPLLQQTYRGLQPTGNPSEYWAAIYNDEKKSTEIGRYNDKTLTFKSVLEIAEISLDSMDVWVDENGAKVYFVYEGHLLALPLTNSNK